MTGRRLAGRVVLVTGAASGFGRAAANRFAAEGARLVLVDVAEIGGGVLADLADARAVFVKADVADEAQLTSAVDTAVSHHGGLDVMVNNAGVLGGGWIDEDGASEHLWRQLHINVGGVWNGCRAAIKVMRCRSGGVILNTVSTAALVPTPAAPAYGLAKAAVLHLTRSLAAGYGRDGIRVNAVLPGPAPTGIFGPGEVQRADLESIYVPNIPLGRLADPDDIARAMTFLASDDAAFITGATLTVDGGFQPRFVSRSIE